MSLALTNNDTAPNKARPVSRDFVGPLVATLLGVPQATLGFSPGHPEGWLAQASEAVAPRYTGRGLAPPSRLWPPWPRVSLSS